MNERKLEYRLKEWGDFNIKHKEHADELGENALHRYSEFGYTEPTTGQMKVDKDGAPLGRDTVLSPDMPTRLQKVSVAVNKLDDLRKRCIEKAYCLPVREDGQPHTISQMARMLQINKGKFKAELRKGKRDLEKLL